MNSNKTARKQFISNALLNILLTLCYVGVCYGISVALKRFSPVAQEEPKKNFVPETNPFCKLCNFTPTIKPSSSSTDLIITFLTSFNDRSEMMLRSIRSTGCAATIICFTPEGVDFPRELEACDIKHVKVKFNQSMKNAIGKFRWETYQKYLKIHWRKYRRVMQTDAYDAFFFGDPFAYATRTDALYFESEEEKVGYCPYNRVWVERCFDENVEAVFQQAILCSGSLIGGIKPFMEFMNAMIAQPGWRRCLDHNGYDQGAFIYAYYTKKWNYTNIVLPCNSPFVTLHYCRKDKNLEILSKEGKSKYIFIHQYTRYDDMINQLNSICNFS